MDRDIMLIWVSRFLEKANDKQLRYLMNFIRGYLGIDD